MTKRTPTVQAQAATAIRKMLKEHGIKARVRSSSASMMTAVDVTVYDQLPAAFKQIEAACNAYQYGHFDGMQDLYEYSNRNDDLPQVKYVTVTNEISEDRMRDAWAFTCCYFDGQIENSEARTAETYNDRVLLARVLDGSAGDWLRWQKPRVRAA